MSNTKISRSLPNDEYQAAIGANAPTALNPFATIADAGAGTYLPLAGGTMVGDIALNANKITNGTGSLIVLDTAIGHVNTVNSDSMGINSFYGRVTYINNALGIDGKLDFDAITAARIWDLPDASGTIALEVSSSFQVLTDQATITWDYALGYNAEVTLAGNRTLAEPTNAVSGDYGTLVITQDGTSGRTLTLPASFKVVNGAHGAITLTNDPSAIDSISWVKKGSIFLVSLGLNFN